MPTFPSTSKPKPSTRISSSTATPGCVCVEASKLTHAPMSNFFRFGNFVLDPARRTLSRAGSPISLTPKAFDVVLFLVQNPNRLVTKEELLQAVWGDTFVEEGNLTQYISLLRKALGDNSEDTRLIVTIARKGYQFTADVAESQAAESGKKIAVQVRSAEISPADTQTLLKSPADEAVTKAPMYLRNAAALAAATLILAAIAYTTWRHFARTPPSKSQKIMLAVLPFANLTGDPRKEYLSGRPDRGNDFTVRPPESGTVGRDRANFRHGIQKQERTTGPDWTRTFCAVRAGEQPSRKRKSDTSYRSAHSGKGPNSLVVPGLRLSFERRYQYRRRSSQVCCPANPTPPDVSTTSRLGATALS